MKRAPRLGRPRMDRAVIRGRKFTVRLRQEEYLDLQFQAVRRRTTVSRLVRERLTAGGQPVAAVDCETATVQTAGGAQ